MKYVRISTICILFSICILVPTLVVAQELRDVKGHFSASDNSHMDGKTKARSESFQSPSGSFHMSHGDLVRGLNTEAEDSSLAAAVNLLPKEEEADIEDSEPIVLFDTFAIKEPKETTKSVIKKTPKNSEPKNRVSVADRIKSVADQVNDERLGDNMVTRTAELMNQVRKLSGKISGINMSVPKAKWQTPKVKIPSSNNGLISIRKQLQDLKQTNNR